MIDRQLETNDDNNGNSNNNPNNNTPDIFIIMNFLEERKKIQNLITNKEYNSLYDYFVNKFKDFSMSMDISKEKVYKKIIMCISCLKYFEFVRNSNYEKAYETFSVLDSTYWNSYNAITVCLYDYDNKLKDYTLDNLSALLCYENPMYNNEVKHLLDINQHVILANQINSLILELAGLNSESVLEICMKQVSGCDYAMKYIKNSFGENLKL